MLFFTDIFTYSINLLHTSSCQCGILRASMRGGCSQATPALLKCNGAAALLQLPSLCCSGRVWPHSKPTAAIPIPSPTSPYPSHYRERWLFMQSPFHNPMHWPVVLHREPRKHQSKSAVWHWLHDPTSPTPTCLGTQGQLQVSITWRKQPASSVCITCWRRKTTESEGGQKQQPGEEEFIKRKGKGSKVFV